MNRLKKMNKDLHDMRKIFQTTLILGLALITMPVYAARPAPTPSPSPNAVCLDPGHGGSDPGAQYNGVSEKDLNLTEALKVGDKLTTSGYQVYYTRTTDVALDNAARYNYCNSTPSAITVSIHHNGSTDHSADYTTALWSGNDDKALASTIASSVSTALGTRNAGTSRFQSGVLLKTNMPATISEGFFVSSDYEQALLPTRLDTEADGLYNGITSYLATH